MPKKRKEKRKGGRSLRKGLIRESIDAAIITNYLEAFVKFQVPNF